MINAVPGDGGLLDSRVGGGSPYELSMTEEFIFYTVCRITYVLDSAQYQVPLRLPPALSASWRLGRGRARMPLCRAASVYPALKTQAAASAASPQHIRALAERVSAHSALRLTTSL